MRTGRHPGRATCQATLRLSIAKCLHVMYRWRARCLLLWTGSTSETAPTPASHRIAQPSITGARQGVLLPGQCTRGASIQHRTSNQSATPARVDFRLWTVCDQRFVPWVPQHVVTVRRFDGDGMLHAVRISGGRASYTNSYVRTTRLAKERAAGRSIFSKVCNPASPTACL